MKFDCNSGDRGPSVRDNRLTDKAHGGGAAMVIRIQDEPQKNTHLPIVSTLSWVLNTTACFPRDQYGVGKGKRDDTCDHGYSCGLLFALYDTWYMMN